MNPLLSIIVPVYNVEKFLNQCLSSIFDAAQNVLSQIEVITVNDGSPDNSYLIVDKYKAKYPDTLFPITQENQGLSMARNNGLDAAKGDYIWFIDSDDWILKDSIERVLLVVKEKPDVDLFSSILKQYFEKDGSYSFKPHEGKQIYSGFEYMLNKFPIGAAQRFIYKRSFLVNNKFRFAPRLLHEDAIWGFSMTYLANKVYILKEPLYIYRIRESQSIMSSISVKSARDLMVGHKMLIDFMNQKVKSEDKRQYRILIFGMIKTLLDFCKHLIGNAEYTEFMKQNIAYIRKEAFWLFKNDSFNPQGLLIAISPNLFSIACRILKK